MYIHVFASHCVLTSQGSGVALVRRESGRRSRGRGGGRGGQRGGGGGGGEQDVMEMRKLLEASQKEIQELRERKASLERECVIYQSQLEVRDSCTAHSQQLTFL